MQTSFVIFAFLKTIWTNYSSIFKKTLYSIIGIICIYFFFFLTLVPYVSRLDQQLIPELPSISHTIYQNYGQPFSLSSNYGLFALMTTERNEIVIQGSKDKLQWRSYELPFQPGNLNQMPPFIAPYQPRVDWQMWFAALGNYRHNQWFMSLLCRIMQNSSEVKKLFKINPFPNKPPPYMRAVLYHYHFAKPGNHTAWWRKRFRSEYISAIQLHDIASYFPIPTRNKTLIQPIPSIDPSSLPLFFGIIAVVIPILICFQPPAIRIF